MADGDFESLEIRPHSADHDISDFPGSPSQRDYQNDHEEYEEDDYGADDFADDYHAPDSAAAAFDSGEGVAKEDKEKEKEGGERRAENERDDEQQARGRQRERYGDMERNAQKNSGQLNGEEESLEQSGNLGTDKNNDNNVAAEKRGVSVAEGPQYSSFSPERNENQRQSKSKAKSSPSKGTPAGKSTASSRGSKTTATGASRNKKLKPLVFHRGMTARQKLELINDQIAQLRALRQAEHDAAEERATGRRSRPTSRSHSRSKSPSKGGKSNNTHTVTPLQEESGQQREDEYADEEFEGELGGKSTTMGQKSGKSPPKSLSPTKKKLGLHHPNLEYVFGEVIYSPYMTAPNKTYPEETFRMAEKIAKLKKEGYKFQSIPQEKKPYDLPKVRQRFIDEIVNFHICFTDADENAARLVKSRSVGSSAADLLSMLDRESLGGSSIDSSAALPIFSKSYSLRCAEARGGPKKFKQQLRQLKKQRFPSAVLINENRGDDVLLSATASREGSRPGSSNNIKPTVSWDGELEQQQQQQEHGHGQEQRRFDPFEERRAAKKKAREQQKQQMREQQIATKKAAQEREARSRERAKSREVRAKSREKEADRLDVREQDKQREKEKKNKRASRSYSASSPSPPTPVHVSDPVVAVAAPVKEEPVVEAPVLSAALTEPVPASPAVSPPPALTLEGEKQGGVLPAEAMEKREPEQEKDEELGDDYGEDFDSPSRTASSKIILNSEVTTDLQAEKAPLAPAEGVRENNEVNEGANEVEQEGEREKESKFEGVLKEVVPSSPTEDAYDDEDFLDATPTPYLKTRADDTSERGEEGREGEVEEERGGVEAVQAQLDALNLSKELFPPTAAADEDDNDGGEEGEQGGVNEVEQRGAGCSSAEYEDGTEDPGMAPEEQQQQQQEGQGGREGKCENEGEEEKGLEDQMFQTGSTVDPFPHLSDGPVELLSPSPPALAAEMYLVEPVKSVENNPDWNADPVPAMMDAERENGEEKDGEKEKEGEKEEEEGCAADAQFELEKIAAPALIEDTAAAAAAASSTTADDDDAAVVVASNDDGGEELESAAAAGASSEGKEGEQEECEGEGEGEASMLENMTKRVEDLVKDAGEALQDAAEDLLDAVGGGPSSEKKEEENKVEKEGGDLSAATAPVDTHFAENLGAQEEGEEGESGGKEGEKEGEKGGATAAVIDPNADDSEDADAVAAAAAAAKAETKARAREEKEKRREKRRKKKEKKLRRKQRESRESASRKGFLLPDSGKNHPGLESEGEVLYTGVQEQQQQRGGYASSDGEETDGEGEGEGEGDADDSSSLLSHNSIDSLASDPMMRMIPIAHQGNNHRVGKSVSGGDPAAAGAVAGSLSKSVSYGEGMGGSGSIYGGFAASGDSAATYGTAVEPILEKGESRLYDLSEKSRSLTPEAGGGVSNHADVNIQGEIKGERKEEGEKEVVKEGTQVAAASDDYEESFEEDA